MTEALCGCTTPDVRTSAATGQRHCANCSGVLPAKHDEKLMVALLRCVASLERKVDVLIEAHARKGTP